MMHCLKICLLGFIVTWLGCQSPEKADLILHNAVVYTVDDSFSKTEALAIKAGKIIGLGASDEILEAYTAPEIIDIEGKYIYPGFIDAHCHFFGYGQFLSQVDLTGTTSFAAVVDRTVKHANANAGDWIVGRGWDQNDWAIKNFPGKDTLDQLFPDRAVFLKRIDGHAALANQKALDAAGITAQTTVDGGMIEVKEGRLTGILIDNAVDLVKNVIPAPGEQEIRTALLAAQKDCFAVGLTTVDDAGLDKQVIDMMDQLHNQGKLKMRIYAMLNPTEENYQHYYTSGPYKSDRLNVRSFKVYADGALGSRGARLKQPYHDQPGHHGFLINDSAFFMEHTSVMYEKGFQVNTHCIGDAANRMVLDIYGQVLGGDRGKRWRIEHAQVVDPVDLEKFGRFGILPSVQPTHATSDMYWAGERLGNERIPHAYAYQQLLEQNQMIAHGSDFPVEHINPLFGFYAAIARKDHKGYPEKGFQPENSLSREQALKAMTIWAAYANFEEPEKGSLEPGKLADLVVLEQDIMHIPEDSIITTEVRMTVVDGEIVYRR